MGWGGGGGGPCDFSVSPKSKSLFLLFFRDLVGLGGLVGQGDLDLGLTKTRHLNNNQNSQHSFI